jgi:hypothetical protein
MSFLSDLDLSDVVEPRVVEADMEYELRITDVREGTNKNGGPYIMPRFEIVGEIGAKDVSHYIGLPDSTMDAKKLNNTKYRIKQFLEAFDLDPQTDTSDWVGAQGWAVLGVQDNEQYGEQNFIKRFQIMR